MKVYLVLVLFSFAVSSIVAQKDQQFNGTCPVVSTPLNFTEKDFAGKWYEIKKFNSSLVSGDCGVPSYVLAKTGFNVTIVTKNITQNKDFTTKLELKRQVVNPLPGRYDVYANNKKERIPQFVLDTDYKTYSIEWGCVYNSSSKANIQRLTINSRQKTLNSTMINKTIDVLKKFKIDHTKLRDVVQDDKKCGKRFL